MSLNFIQIICAFIRNYSRSMLCHPLDDCLTIYSSYRSTTVRWRESPPLTNRNFTCLIVSLSLYSYIHYSAVFAFNVLVNNHSFLHRGYFHFACKDDFYVEGAGTGQPVNGAIPSLPSPTMPTFNMAAQTPNGQPGGGEAVYTNGIPQTYPARKY